MNGWKLTGFDAVEIELGRENRSISQDRQPSSSDGFRLPVRNGQRGRNSNYRRDDGASHLRPQDSDAAAGSSIG